MGGFVQELVEKAERLGDPKCIGIARHLAETEVDFSPSSIMRKFGVGWNFNAKVFKRLSGVSLRTAAARARAERIAQAMLEDPEMTTSEAAERFGVSSPRSLVNILRYHFGLNTKELRKVARRRSLGLL